jgi:Zn-dependent protease with chaperone function
MSPRIEKNARSHFYPSTWTWLEQGVERQTKAIVGAIACGWTGLPVALWLAAAGVVIGFIAGIFGASHIGLAHTLHVDEGASFIGAIVGAFVGAFGGIVLIYIWFFEEPLRIAGAFLSGLLIGGLGIALLAAVEPKLMRLRGYRELSKRERERINPLLVETGRRMGLSVVPELWISDIPKPAAWAHMRAIVITRGLLGDYDATERGPTPDLDDAALSAILAHELHHWHVGDVVGNTMVWACFLPVVIVFNGLSWVKTKSGGLGTLGWFFFWPAWVCTKLVVLVMTARNRQQEYEADAQTARLGDDYRLGLRRALDDLAEWEHARSGWEAALAATHPSIELRLERLESRPPREPLPTTPQPKPAPAKAPPPVARGPWRGRTTTPPASSLLLSGASSLPPPTPPAPPADEPAVAPAETTPPPRPSRPAKAKPDTSKTARPPSGGKSVTPSKPPPKKSTKKPAQAEDADDAEWRWFGREPPEKT